MNDPFDNMEGGDIFTMKLATRKAIPALIALWGFSDSGKTYSALRLARGLVGPKGKIALIDTENRRAEIYAGMFGGWYHIDMQPPFTSQRYMAAFDVAMKGGANVIIVDSMSHVWEGEGGVLDQADASKAKGLAKWKEPKMAYKRMTNALFRAPVNMIFCIRAKEKFVQVGRGNDATIQSAGLVPIADSRFIYEMTVSAHMESGARTPVAPIKAPEEIAHAIRPGEFITEKAGELIAKWLAGGEAIDHAAEALRRVARDEAMKGSIHLRDWWSGNVRKADRPILDPILPELRELASQADEEQAKAAMTAAEATGSANAGGDPLDDQFTGKALDTEAPL